MSFQTGALDERALLRGFRRAVAEGRMSDALIDIRNSLRGGELSAQGIERAGALILEVVANRPTDSAISLLLLGQLTTSWLKNAIAAVALRRGVTVLVEEGQYDQVLQDVDALPVMSRDIAPLVVLLPWNDRLLSGAGRAITQRIDDEIGYWRTVWTNLRAKGVSRIIQVGFDWIGSGPLGHHLGNRVGGPVQIVGAANEALRGALPGDAYFVAMDEISGLQGRLAFYDLRSQYWTRQPFSEEGLVAVAEHVVAGVCALTTGPRKVLVLDLDNTLWGGIVGETGALGITLGGSPDGEAFLAFQRYVKDLASRGVLLAVCSKNDSAAALEPFVSHPDSVLKTSDFAAFEASWEPKVIALRRIAETLDLALDSFVFFDDNPAERDHVRRALPDVMVVDVPLDPADYIRAVEMTLAFEALTLTAEDARRSEMYAARRAGGEPSEKAGSVHEHLSSLEMVGRIRPVTSSDLPRVVQLLGRTNQFNLTTRRHGEAEVRSFMSHPRGIALTLRLRDRFGDHGLVAVLLAAPARDDEHALVVDTLLMSCRVIGRTAEHLLVDHLLDEARRHGYRTVRGEYLPTPRNGLVRDFWPSMGFSRRMGADASVDGGEVFELDLAAAAHPTSFVRGEH